MAKLRGVVAFNAANGLVRKLLPQLETHDLLILDLTDVLSVDDTAALSMAQLCSQAESMGRWAAARLPSCLGNMHNEPQCKPANNAPS